MNWSVPPMWRGQTVAILASGPSMSRDAADRVSGLPTIAINNTVNLAPWADMLYAADLEWWQYSKIPPAFCGRKVSLSEVPGVLRLRNSFGPPPDKWAGFDPDPSALRSGGNSGYQALHLAIHAGASRVLLCGFDMNGGHWHPEHVAPLRTTHPDSYALFAARFASLLPAIAERGVEVLNCSPSSAITAFPRMTLESALGSRMERASA